MRCPSTKRLRATFPNLQRGQATLIRRLAHDVHHRDTLRNTIEARCPKTHAYALSCYNDPYDGGMWRRTMMLHAIDEILGTCGVEALGPVDMHKGPPFEYCNTGETYAATIVYSRDSDMLRIASWGDVAERHEHEWEES
jgi:hypothetical protein